MARMSEGRSKKSTVPKKDVAKITRLPSRSKKNAGMLAEHNGSALNHASDKDAESVRLKRSDEYDGSVSDMPMSEQVSEEKPVDGKHVVDADSAMHYRIAEQAFVLFQENGCQHGRDWADWFEAERQITQTRQSSRDE